MAIRLVLVMVKVMGVALMVSCAAQLDPGVWVGATFEEVQRGFGNPEVVLINDSGSRVYVFREAPRNLTQTKLAYGDTKVAMEDAPCAVLFEFVEETVARWDWEEEGCQNFDLPLPYQVRVPPPVE